MSLRPTPCVKSARLPACFFRSYRHSACRDPPDLPPLPPVLQIAAHISGLVPQLASGQREDRERYGKETRRGGETCNAVWAWDHRQKQRGSLVSAGRALEPHNCGRLRLHVTTELTCRFPERQAVDVSVPRERYGDAADSEWTPLTLHHVLPHQVVTADNLIQPQCRRDMRLARQRHRARPLLPHRAEPFRQARERSEQVEIDGTCYATICHISELDPGLDCIIITHLGVSPRSRFASQIGHLDTESRFAPLMIRRWLRARQASQHEVLKGDPSPARTACRSLG